MQEKFPLNKHKIINDPVHGFIKIPFDIIYELLEHPIFQRLRRISQLGMTSYVYPGATHTRFQHALGAMHLMGNAIAVIRSKGHEITEEEAEAVTIAILLHDIGHGPYSHSLEHSLMKGMQHEEISLMMMELLNETFEGKLDMAIQIFKNEYPKKFLHQLVSSQLDVDRLDYLKRDSFFTGVTEGVIGADRMIKMLQVVDDRLVIEEKGIYSIEKFLVARRLMYWQVYLHKSVLAADQLLIMVLQRASALAQKGVKLTASPGLEYFLYERGGSLNEQNQREFLLQFADLDDNDIISAAKLWSRHDDQLLGLICRSFISRKLPRIEIREEPFEEERVMRLRELVASQFKLSEEDARQMVVTDSVTNHAYSALNDNIKILGKDGSIMDISEASDILNVSVLSKTVRKFFLCYPKNLQELF